MTNILHQLERAEDDANLAFLRSEVARLRLTDAEREAVEAAARIIDAYDEEMDGFPSGASATLRGLLARCATGSGESHE